MYDTRKLRFHLNEYNNEISNYIQQVLRIEDRTLKSSLLKFMRVDLYSAIEDLEELERAIQESIMSTEV